jgi:Bacterial self-protective colicin-like immunity
MDFLQKYILLIEDFINERLTGLEFEKQFLELHRKDTYVYPEDVRKPLSILFSDVDSFCSDPEIRDENDIDEIQLREKALIALQSLSDN